MRLFNPRVCTPGVRPLAVMDLDTSLETMPPTGGTVTMHIHTTAACSHAWNHNKHAKYFTTPVLINLTSVLQPVGLSTSQEEWHQNPPQQRGQGWPGANQVRFLRGFVIRCSRCQVGHFENSQSAYYTFLKLLYRPFKWVWVWVWVWKSDWLGVQHVYNLSRWQNLWLLSLNLTQWASQKIKYIIEKLTNQ